MERKISHAIFEIVNGQLFSQIPRLFMQEGK